MTDAKVTLTVKSMSSADNRRNVGAGHRNGGGTVSWGHGEDPSTILQPV